MELQERINVLIQGAEIAQKKGALSLKDAYFAKLAIDALKNNSSIKDALEILVKVAVSGQKAGVYSLNDAALLYLASDNIESALQPPAPQVPQPAPQPAPQEPEVKVAKKTKKES